jgi:lipopolysaccharide/colanic/teichoic acid biosynthesis glycosyltransferase
LSFLPAAATASSYPPGRRFFDVALTMLLLPPALLVGALAAIAIFIDSPGPIFFRSRRVGRHGVPFDMLKFRTMRHLAAGPRLTSKGDDRQTPVGRFLASSRLDELPQLWNVLKGQMRLVGPRPELEEFVEEQRDSYERILQVPPGLTGPSQLVYADEGALLASTADRETLYRERILPGKVRLDLEYAESSTLLGDLSLIARTCLLPLVRMGYRLGAFLGAGPQGRVMAARLLLAVAAAAAILALFTIEASAGSA